MKQDLAKALKFSVPMTLAVVLAFAAHITLYAFLEPKAITLTQLALNYFLLLVLFVTGQVIIATERQNGKTPFQKAVKKTMWQRLLLSVVFVLFTSSSVTNPILFSLHFIIPYFIFTGVSVYRSRQLLESA